jgi:hypothetical protein
MNEKIEVSLDEAVTITTDSGQTYRATLEEGVVSISYEDNERWLWAGEGTWDGTGIAHCNADLGEDGYELLNAAISDALSDSET